MHRPAPAASRRPRIALAHDWLVGLRGGEWVLDAIIRTLSPWADLVGLYVMFDDRRPLTPAIDALPRTVAGLGRFPGSNAARRWLLPFYPAAVDDLARRLARDHADHPIDLLLSTSSAAVKGIKPPQGVPHLCYCHAPARYLWSRGGDYAADSPLRRAGLAIFGPMLRAWDRETAAHVTTFLANSRHTAAEIRRCYRRDAVVLHPPVRTGFFTPAPDAPRGEHWLVVSALEPYKRVETAIAAAMLAGKHLRVVGDGSQRARLERLTRSSRAAVRVELLGRISDDQLRDEYRSARLLLFPQVEDFGIVAVEALACGLPVVARAAGGALDFIREGVNGSLAHGDSAAALVAASHRAPRDAAFACAASARPFDSASFERAINAAARASLRTR